MVEKWFRSKPKSASAKRFLRSLGAMKPIAASEMELSNRSIVCVTGVLSHCGLRKANGKMGVVTGIRSLPGIAGDIPACEGFPLHGAIEIIKALGPTAHQSV